MTHRFHRPSHFHCPRRPLATPNAGADKLDNLVCGNCSRGPGRNDPNVSVLAWLEHAVD
jgi:hypothetical protein